MTKEEFMQKAIGNRSRDALAEELYGVYLSLRAACPMIDDAHQDDPWPAELHLADVLDKYVIRPMSAKRSEIEEMPDCVIKVKLLGDNGVRSDQSPEYLERTIEFVFLSGVGLEVRIGDCGGQTITHITFKESDFKDVEPVFKSLFDIRRAVIRAKPKADLL